MPWHDRVANTWHDSGLIDTRYQANQWAAFRLRRTVRCVAQNSKHSSTVEVTVIGGGAAGLTAAYFAAKHGAKVTVLESTAEAGKKILISGGKRCNVLPGDIELDRDYTTESSKSALRAVFSGWDLWSCKEWLETELGLQLAFDEATTKYFPKSNSARQVRDQLLDACRQQGVSIRYSSKLEGLEGEGSGWVCRLAGGQRHTSQKVIMATGGLSFPTMGTDGKGMRLMEGLGHTLHQPYAALTPLKGTHVASTQLAGLSMYEVQLQCKYPKSGKGANKKGPVAERSAMLFTHKGFSRPAVLDLSHHLVRAQARGQDTPILKVNWTAESRSSWEERFRSHGSMRSDILLRQYGIPMRLASALAQDHRADDKVIAQLNKEQLRGLIDALVDYKLQCTGHEGYAKAEVTGGGVRLNDMDCSTLESRLHPGLHMCGEILDVFGRIGGFNFYWAWLSGRVAGIGTCKP